MNEGLLMSSSYVGRPIPNWGRKGERGGGLNDRPHSRDTDVRMNPKLRGAGPCIF